VFCESILYLDVYCVHDLLLSLFLVPPGISGTPYIVGILWVKNM
jgi:hypothetical protein